MVGVKSRLLSSNPEERPNLAPEPSRPASQMTSFFKSSTAKDRLLPLPRDGQPDIAGLIRVLAVLLLHARERQRLLRRSIRLIIFKMLCCAIQDGFAHLRNIPLRHPPIGTGDILLCTMDLQHTGDLRIEGRVCLISDTGVAQTLPLASSNSADSHHSIR